MKNQDILRGVSLINLGTMASKHFFYACRNAYKKLSLMLKGYRAEKNFSLPNLDKQLKVEEFKQLQKTIYDYEDAAYKSKQRELTANTLLHLGATSIYTLTAFQIYQDKFTNIAYNPVNATAMADLAYTGISHCMKS